MCMCIIAGHMWFMQNSWSHVVYAEQLVTCGKIRTAVQMWITRNSTAVQMYDMRIRCSHVNIYDMRNSCSHVNICDMRNSCLHVNIYDMRISS